MKFESGYFDLCNLLYSAIEVVEKLRVTLINFLVGVALSNFLSSSAGLVIVLKRNDDQAP